MNPTLFDDICASRHQNADTSIAANKEANKSKAYWRQRVLGVIAELRQATLEDVCTRLGKSSNSISGRISELRASKSIKIVGKRGLFRVYEVSR